MKNNVTHNIILYMIVAGVSILIAGVIRMFAVRLGFDDFTAFIVFVIALIVLAIAYLSIHTLLENFLLPLISKGLLLIPFFNKMEEKAKSEEPTKENNVVAKEDSSEPQSKSLEEIRTEQRQHINKKQDHKLCTALDYTRKTFALYLSDEQINVLCNNVCVFTEQLDIDKLQAVSVKDLTAIDLRHYGWNIWNFFRTLNQTETAQFLKVVFPNSFNDAEVLSIKRHLKDDEQKGIIKIEDSIAP